MYMYVEKVKKNRGDYFYLFIYLFFSSDSSQRYHVYCLLFNEYCRIYLVNMNTSICVINTVSIFRRKR